MSAKIQLRGCLTAVATIMLWGSCSSAAVLAVNCSTGGTIQSAVDMAMPGDIVSVTGTCNENVLIRNEVTRVTLNGNNRTATINGGFNATSPAITIRGKGILVDGFNINGGSDGIGVSRGSNAVINNNFIQAATYGVAVDQESLAILTNNTIEQNSGAGILIDGNSSARIGFNLDTDGAGSPNAIRFNGEGITVLNGSNAKIVGNNISQNSIGAVFVFGFSHVALAGNDISNNGGNQAILLQRFSGLNLADFAPPVLGLNPNITTSNNAGFAIVCESGGFVNGTIGTLNGFAGPKKIVSPCIDGL